MKLTSFNIGIKIDNAEAVAKYLQSTEADIICLQEVARPLDDKAFPLYRSKEVIDALLGEEYPYIFFAPEWVSDSFKKNKELYRDLGGMTEQGKYILSKYEITHGYNYFYHKDYEFDSDRTHFYEGDDHGRALQVCDIEIDGKLIQIANIHGLYTKDKKDTERSINQSKFILDKMQSRKLPTMILGDFNLFPDTKSIAMINEKYINLIEKFNINTTRPDPTNKFNAKRNVVDYIFVSDNFLIKGLTIGRTDISDHYPLILDFESK